MTASTSQTLSSQWGGLSPHLIASFWEVDRNGNTVRDKNGNFVTVQAPFSESSLEVNLNWISPFESAGAEKTFPTLLAMLESGASQPVIDSLKNVASATGASGGVIDTLNTIDNKTLKEFQGRTGITKLNSMQVFTGMPPLEFSVTLIFRAWQDPVSEVMAPTDQLMAWALPVDLAANSTIISNLLNQTAKTINNAPGTTQAKDWLNAILPSQGPIFVAMKYKNMTFSPLVIKSVHYPIDSPIDSNGNFTELKIQLNLATLAAIDRTDWTSARNPGLPFA